MSELFRRARELEDASEHLCCAVADWSGGERGADDMVRQALGVAKMAQTLADACERETFTIGDTK